VIEPTAHRFEASDGASLHVTAWEPPSDAVSAQIVVVHGIQSHAGWYDRLGRSLAEAGHTAFFPDRRGSGSNKVDRGHAPGPGRLVADLAEFLDQLDPHRPRILAGISWGGKLCALTAARHPKRVDGLALICPGLAPVVGVPKWRKLLILLAFLFRPRTRFPIPLNDPELFTANPEAQAFIAQDPKALREATAGLLASSALIDRRLRRLRAPIPRPSLLMIAGRDRIIDNERTQALFERLTTEDRLVIAYPDAHHTLEFEPDPECYARDLIEWIGSVPSPKEPPASIAH